MLVLVFDTETTGLPKNREINKNTISGWPSIVQFSYVIYDTQNNQIVKEFDRIIKVYTNVVISDECIKIHGITNEMSSAQGVIIQTVLLEFFTDVSSADLIVGHNIDFDIKMIKSELFRLTYHDNTDDLLIYIKCLKQLDSLTNIYCTMKETKQLCNIEAQYKNGNKYIKFPKLRELYEFLFKELPTGFHNSLNDVKYTLRCFVKVKFNTDINNLYA